MRQLKTLLLAVFAIAALGVFAASANALELPSTSYTEASEGTLNGESTTAKTEFFGIVNLKGVGWLITTEGTIANHAILWKTDTLFTAVKLGSTNCSSAGEAAGTVLIGGLEYHLVWRIGHLLPLLLALVPETAITCGTTKIKVRGQVLSSVSPFKEVVKPGSHFKGAALCSTGGTPEFTEYENDEEKAVSVKLESNGGLGWQKSCELIEGQVELEPSAAAEVA